MLEAKQLEAGPRVKFKATRLGDIDSLLTKESSRREVQKNCEEMADALSEMEEMGVTPVAPDGKVGGNGAVKLMLERKSYLLVSKSGKYPGRMNVNKDFCLVSSYNRSEWSAAYYSHSDDIVPTSDTPLHWYILQETKKYNWPLTPKWCLHGHAFETEEEAKLLKIPISSDETLFSTPEDIDALSRLFDDYAYPENSAFVRKGHGFLVLGQTCDEALNVLKNLNNKKDQN